MHDAAQRSFARHALELLLASALLAGACTGTQASVVPAKRAAAVSSEVSATCPLVTTAEARSLVDKYCVSCHSPSGSAGEDYDFRNDTAISARRSNIEAKLRLHVMPPPSAPQPSEAERTTLRCWAKQ